MGTSPFTLLQYMLNITYLTPGTTEMGILTADAQSSYTQLNRGLKYSSAGKKLNMKRIYLNTVVKQGGIQHIKCLFTTLLYEVFQISYLPSDLHQSLLSSYCPDVGLAHLPSASRYCMALCCLQGASG